MRRSVASLALTVVLWPGVARAAEDYYREPINYETAQPDNAVSRLVARLDAGAKPAHDAEFGYLPWLLRELAVSPKSQTLVYSKTSLQRDRISPRTPRALYFNDDVYVGYCQAGDVLEISAVDPRLGTVFYTVDQHDKAKALVRRQNDACLLCHGGSQTRNVPGHLVRSLFVDPQGQPIFSAGSHRIDHTSPLAKRWGGWYVTGTHGDQGHLGNLLVRTRRVEEPVDNRAGHNVTALGDRIDATRYLSPHSDLVALMVLEHQAEGHNLLTRANFGTRQALHLQESLNREMKLPADHQWDSTAARLRGACDPLVKYLLFCDEAALTAKIEGTSGFREEFAKAGVRDGKGRSLRDFDLERRLFRYPCSYLIYSPSFDALPAAAREYIYQRLHDVLTGKDESPAFKHLMADDRRAILEILRETKKGLPESWKAG